MVQADEVIEVLGVRLESVSKIRKGRESEGSPVRSRRAFAHVPQGANLLSRPRDLPEIPLIRPVVGDEELEEVERVLRSGWLAQGPEVRKFEREIEVYLGAKHAVATSSCTTALSLAIAALGLRKNGQVIIPDFTFPATANVVVLGTMQPVLADTNRRNYAISQSEVAGGIGKKTQAILPVHPFGHPFEMDEIYEIAEKNSLEVIEDAATAFGTKYKGRKVGQGPRSLLQFSSQKTDYYCRRRVSCHRRR